MSSFISSRRTLSLAAVLLAAAGALPAVAAERSGVDGHDRYLQGGPTLAAMSATAQSRPSDSARAYERLLNGSPVSASTRNAAQRPQLDAVATYQRYLNGAPATSVEGQIDVAAEAGSTLR